MTRALRDMELRQRCLKLGGVLRSDIAHLHLVDAVQHAAMAPVRRSARRTTPQQARAFRNSMPQ
jgi:hypothetical protein